jgi:hypothetical protein
MNKIDLISVKVISSKMIALHQVMKIAFFNQKLIAFKIRNMLRNFLPKIFIKIIKMIFNSFKKINLANFIAIKVKRCIS